MIEQVPLAALRMSEDKRGSFDAIWHPRLRTTTESFNTREGRLHQRLSGRVNIKEVRLIRTRIMGCGQRLKAEKREKVGFISGSPGD
ncbi:hypothetical protein [Aeromonas rivipollensis]|uniref:hypothetical protein n=1 Tax=Aeromonas rivipollensis TaxID=948519 RepID=UPI00372D2508